MNDGLYRVSVVIGAIVGLVLFQVCELMFESPGFVILHPEGPGLFTEVVIFASSMAAGFSITFAFSHLVSWIVEGFSQRHHR